MPTAYNEVTDEDITPFERMSVQLFLKFIMTGNKKTLYNLQDKFRNFSNNLSDLIRAFENKTKGDTLLW